jgi:hypothetical protein
MSENLIHADIFFFITSIAVIVVGISLTIVLVYLIRILHNIDSLTKKVEHETGELLSDVRLLRHEIKSEGFKLKHLFSFILGFITKATRKAKSVKKDK